MSGWNWIHAGLEVATYAKARSAQRDLEEMKTAAEREAARQILIEAMRNFVFDIWRDIQLVEEHAAEQPQQAYIVSKALEWRFLDSGLSAEMFPDFKDKEYVFNTQKKISDVIQHSQKKLSSEELADSDTAVNYIIEMPALQLAIEAFAAQESLDETATEWKRLSKADGRKTLFLSIAIVGTIFSLCGGLPLATAGIGMIGSFEASNVSWGIAYILLATLMITGTIAAFIPGTKKNAEFKSLKEKREAWKGMLLPEEESKRVNALFGGQGSGNLEQLHVERTAFLTPLLGSDFQGQLKSG